MAFEKEGIAQIEFEELQKIVEDKDRAQVIIDVREPDEYDEGHIPGIPLIPMHTIPAVISEFDKDKEYIFVCRSGGRSQNVAKFFIENGFDKVTNYAGGMLAWDADKNTGLEKVITNIEELYKK